MTDADIFALLKPQLKDMSDDSAFFPSVCTPHKQIE